MWTGTVDDLRTVNIGLHTSYRRAQDRADWRNFVTTSSLRTDDDNDYDVGLVAQW